MYAIKTEGTQNIS